MNYNNITKKLHSLIESSYLEKNFKIDNFNSKNSRSFIFSSSNGLYYPNTSEEFDNTINIQNRFEWEKISSTIINKRKFIFLRDIYKQWYMRGINNDINNIDKILEFCKQNVENKDTVITIGTSSGGFLSVIIGLTLNVNRIFSFSGQFQLNTILNYKDDNNTVLRENKNNKYINLEFLLAKNTKSTILYFVSKYSDIDKDDLELAKKYKSIKIFLFNSSVHGIPFPSFVLKYLLNKNDDEILLIYNKFKNIVIHPLHFSIVVCGQWNFIKEFSKYILIKIKYKILNKIN